MAKFGYNVNRIRIRIRIQRDVYFISANTQRKNNKRNSWTEVSDETIPKPKVRKGIFGIVSLDTSIQEFLLLYFLCIFPEMK